MTRLTTGLGGREGTRQKILKATPERSAGTGAASAAEPASSVEPGQRHLMIAEAAYFRAERRNFSPGQELDDWLSAEREIDRGLARAVGKTRIGR
jgi:hypothetical protein